MSSSSVSVVMPEPSVSKTEDIDQTASSENLTNGSQTVPPVVRSVPVTTTVDDMSNLSLSSTNLHPKVIIIIV